MWPSRVYSKKEQKKGGLIIQCGCGRPQKKCLSINFSQVGPLSHPIIISLLPTHSPTGTIQGLNRQFSGIQRYPRGRGFRTPLRIGGINRHNARLGILQNLLKWGLQKNVRCVCTPETYLERLPQLPVQVTFRRRSTRSEILEGVKIRAAILSAEHVWGFCTVLVAWPRRDGIYKKATRLPHRSAWLTVRMLSTGDRYWMYQTCIIHVSQTKNQDTRKRLGAFNFNMDGYPTYFPTIGRITRLLQLGFFPRLWYSPNRA